jgi:hypothetical protein
VLGDKGVAGAGPVPGFFKGFDGLTFAASDNEPMGVRLGNAIEDGFGGAGKVLTGLASPKTDFERTGILEPIPLVGVESGRE